MQRQVLESSLQTDADERLGGLATQSALQIEELIVEVPATGEEAHQDAEPLLPSFISGMMLSDSRRACPQPGREAADTPIPTSSACTTTNVGVLRRDVDRRNRAGERVGAGDELQLPGIVQEQHRRLGRRERLAGRATAKDSATSSSLALTPNALDTSCRTRTRASDDSAALRALQRSALVLQRSVVSNTAVRTTSGIVVANAARS